MHKTKIVIALAAFGIGMACVPAAHAGFVNEAAQQQPQQLAAAGPAPEIKSSPLPDAPAAPAAPSSGRKVTQIGMRPSNVSVPRGKGTDIALGDMVPVVVPREFRLDMSSVNTQQLVEWNGGKPWDAVLTDAITPLGNVEATIDWNQHVVTLRRVASTVSMIAATGSGNDVSAKPAIPLAVAMRWEVKASDVTLRQTLIRWAKDAGWQVSWEIAYDYPVQLEGSFTGSFEDAVDQFMGSLRYSDYPALACMYEANHVVRVLHYGDKKECDK